MFWYWPSYIDLIFRSVIPGLYVGRNMFWIGVISYVSENSSIKLRTLKLGTIVATYTISSLIGAGLVALIKMTVNYYGYGYFIVPILLNLIAAFVGYCHVKDTSDLYKKNYEWLRPKYLLKSFTSILKNKSKIRRVVLAILVLCQSIFVARIGCKLYSYIL
uniref:Uncharacterized protein n=2 Tax=Sipha flava TaxID=143950 RepID=A0A2S2QC55_9HEMI